MASAKVSLVTLCSLLLVSQLIVPAHSWSCCLDYTKRSLPCKRIVSFSIQTINENCDVDAIVFHLPKEKFLCADPKSHHTLRVMKCIDQRRKKDKKILLA